ncbi:MAG: hypothetical protein JW845_05095 [Dehalococcoidales bacterium]|nr:hypothetical protein [Dehalococcoidales bacterium]
MNRGIYKKIDEFKKTSKTEPAWLAYGAVILTIFFAFIILAGRIYTQSYWGVFGLTPEILNINFINYAVISPNVAIVSVIIAVSCILLIIFFKQRFPDFMYEVSNIKALGIVGIIAVSLGIFGVTLIPTLDLSSWTPGLAGLAYGISFLLFVWGWLFWFQAGMMQKGTTPSPWMIRCFSWIKNVPRVIILGFFIVGFSAITIWAMAVTAQQFGSNEAKFMYNTRPVAELQIDSPNGFEDLPLLIKPNGDAVFMAKILTESSEFLYVSTGFNDDKTSLFVKAVPLSRVQAIQYSVNVTRIGK